MTHCSSCGHEVTGAFCGNCGTPAPRPTPPGPSAPSTHEPTVVLPTQAAPTPSTPEPTITVPPPPPTAGAHPAQGPGRGRGPLVLAALVALALVAAGIAWATGLFGGGAKEPKVVMVTQTVAPSAAAQPTTAATTAATASATAAPAPTNESAPPLATVTAPPPAARVTVEATADADADAYAALEGYVAADRVMSPIRGQWVAQLSSKHEGIVDTSQKSTPFTLSDIRAEVDALKSRYANVRVVHQGDWAGSTAGARPMWVTFVDLGASSRDEALAWCEASYPQRGKALLNVCYPRQMRLR